MTKKTISVVEVKSLLRKHGRDVTLFHPLTNPLSCEFLLADTLIPGAWKFSDSTFGGKVVSQFTNRVEKPGCTLKIKGGKLGLVVQQGKRLVEPEAWNDLTLDAICAGSRTEATDDSHSITTRLLEDRYLMVDDAGFLVFSRDEIDVHTGAYPLFPPGADHSVTELDELCFVGDIYPHDNIAHFLLDTLCRAWMAREAFKLPDATIGFPAYDLPYCRELQKILFPGALTLERNKVYSVKKLWIGDYNLHLGKLHPANKVDGRYLAWLRANIAVSPSRHSQVYISRRDAKKRPMRNELNIEAIARSAGFEIVVLSDLSVAEQIALFAGAEVVIGAHGAGMANVAFCKPGSTLVELYSQDGTGTDAFQRLGTALGVRTFMAFGKGFPPGSAAGKMKGWQMEPAYFRKLIKSLGRARGAVAGPAA